MANSESLEDLVKQFAPVTQAKLRGTEIAADADKLRYLLTLPRDEQEGTVSRLSLGLTWEASLPKVANNRESKDQGSIALVAVSGGAGRGGSGICGADDESGASTAIGMRESPPSDPDPVPQVVRVAVNELRPNSVNATIFSDSLADEQLRDLADHLARYGQQEPIRVDVAYTILDGQRRWRALTLIGAKYANVVVDKLQRSRDELEDLVIDAFSLKRKPSLEEQLRVYDIAVRSYTRRYGRVVGRPKKLDKNLSGFWSHKQICTAAAKAAGFGSREPVRQARRVLKEADEETKKAMLSGRLSIGAAYATLRPSADADDDDDESTGGAGTLPDVPRDVAATADEAARQTNTGGNGGRLPPMSEPAVVHPVEEALPQKLSDSPSLPDSTRRPDADLPSRQMPDGVASNARSSKVEEARRGSPTGSAAPAASRRRDRTTAHTESPERRSYLRARGSVVSYIAALRESEEADARRERDEAVSLIDAAAYGTREGDGHAAAPAANRSWSASEGYDGDDAQSGTHHEDVDEDLNVVDGRGDDSEGAEDLNVVGEEDDDEEDLDETEDDEDLDETEDDEGLDDEDLDETEDDEGLDDEGLDETEDEVEAAVDDRRQAGLDATETGEKDDLSRAASREDDDDDIRIQYASKAVWGETFDYSDYEDAADEDAEEPEQQDAGGSEVDDEARSEDDWSDEDEGEDEDEEGDPEVDELLGLKRRRRP